MAAPDAAGISRRLAALTGPGIPAAVDRRVLTAVTGEPIAEVEYVPPLLVQAVLDRMRAAEPGRPVGQQLFDDAAKALESADLDGLDPAAYIRLTALATGLPPSVVEHGLAALADGLRQLGTADAVERPAPDSGPGHRVVWVPRAPVIGVVAASNHSEPHLTWVRALAYGYRVVVRPGGRDPFTPVRLAAALLAAGLPADRLAVLPGDHAVSAHLVKSAPLSIVYGGPDAVRRWGGRSNVLVRGPGRSKAAVGDSVRPGDVAVIDHLARAIAGDSGVRCTNISAIFTSGDPGRLADLLAERLAGYGNPPRFGVDRVDGLRQSLGQFTGFVDHSRDHYGGDPFLALPDGSVAARPVVLSAPDAGHPLIGTELPFPFVVVAPWDGSIGPLRDSLVLNLLGTDPVLADRALAEPTVRRVVTGLTEPWYTLPGLPHDGSLRSFLLEPKAHLGLVPRPGTVPSSGDQGVRP
ncbi:hypothetical protein ABH935_001531 [Catenulispora sp. GAS73]|uniref:aldehyde dehydrogenase family protein n=1 Tax=Catenulispora sp. GAS73 TaxID=3156269 RepID=UPI003514705D